MLEQDPCPLAIFIQSFEMAYPSSAQSAAAAAGSEKRYNRNFPLLFVCFPTAIYATFKGMATFPVPAEWNSFPKANSPNWTSHKKAFILCWIFCLCSCACLPFSNPIPSDPSLGHSLVDHLLIIASTLSKETNGDKISFPPLADRAHLA